VHYPGYRLEQGVLRPFKGVPGPRPTLKKPPEVIESKQLSSEDRELINQMITEAVKEGNTHLLTALLQKLSGLVVSPSAPSSVQTISPAQERFIPVEIDDSLVYAAEETVELEGAVNVQEESVSENVGEARKKLKGLLSRQ